MFGIHVPKQLPITQGPKQSRFRPHPHSPCGNTRELWRSTRATSSRKSAETPRRSFTVALRAILTGNFISLILTYELEERPRALLARGRDYRSTCSLANLFRRRWQEITQHLTYPRRSHAISIDGMACLGLCLRVLNGLVLELELGNRELHSWGPPTCM